LTIARGKVFYLGLWDDYGIRPVIDIWKQLCTKAYKPKPVRRVFILKLKGNGKMRPPGIPTVREQNLFKIETEMDMCHIKSVRCKKFRIYNFRNS